MGSLTVLSRGLRWTMSPLTGRAIEFAIAVRWRARQYIYGQRMSVDACFVHALDFVIAAPLLIGILLYSYYSLCILDLHLGD